MIDPPKANGGDGDDPPEPEIEIIRNYEGLARTLADSDGALLGLDGAPVSDSGIELGTLSNVLRHFSRLYRVVLASRAGLEVRRRGRITDVAGARRLVALPAATGSYAVPMRLDPPPGTLTGDDHGEFEALVALLGADEDQTVEMLTELPERAGDELYRFLKELATSDADLTLATVNRGRLDQEVRVSSGAAASRAATLGETNQATPGLSTIVGKLFRIDVKRKVLAIDVSREGGKTAIEEASFEMSALEEVRAALNHTVSVDVEIHEERRPYEQTARSRTSMVVEVRRVVS